MDNWHPFRLGKRPLLAIRMHRIIVRELGRELPSFFAFAEKIRSSQTTWIVDKLGWLGKNRFNYNSYAHSHSPEHCQTNGGPFKNAEWLFDLHWYTEGKVPYTTTNLHLAVECEWQQKRKKDKANAFSGIKYDFQKLMVTNAEYRLMIFKISHLSDLEVLDIYFAGNIQNYRQLPSGARFLFIAFYKRKKTFYYQELIK